MSNRRKWVAGNWKMNASFSSNESLVAGFKAEVGSDVDVSVFCPAPYLHQVGELTKGTNIVFGAQDISSKANGAFTGEISASMLVEFGVSQVLVGHSERRTYHAESSTEVASKAKAAIEAGIFPVVCVGETLQERESGQVESVLASQLDPVLEKTATFVDNSVWPLAIAYEPVWAIGTGVTASPAQAQQAHEIIRNRVAAVLGSDVANATRILYGGSVKPENAAEIFQQPDIDGGLIGGAALKSDDFSGIIRAARR